MFLVLLIAVAVLLAALLFDMFRRPERAIYLYLLVRFLFPKVWEITLGGEVIVLWRAAETIVFFLVVTLLVSHRRRISNRLASVPMVRKFLLAFLITLLISTVIPLLLAAAGIRSRPVELGVLRQVFVSTHYVFGFGIALAAVVFLDSAEKFLPLFRLLVFCGVVGFLDVLLLNVLDVSSALRIATVGVSGGFGGVMMGSPDALGRVAIFAIFAALTLARITDRRFYYLLALLFVSEIIAAASRPVAVSLLPALLLFFWLGRRPPRVRRVPVFAASLLVVCLFLPWGLYAFQGTSDAIEIFESWTRRQDFFRADVGVLERVVVWVRVADVFLDTFPIGSGGGMLPFYMSAVTGSSVTAHFSLSGRITSDLTLQQYYEQIIDWRSQSGHNLYFEFIAENGLGGILLVVGFWYLVLRSYRRFREHPNSFTPAVQNLLLGLFSMMLAAGLNVATDATFRVYWFYLILFYGVQILVSQAGAQQSVPTLAA